MLALSAASGSPQYVKVRTTDTEKGYVMYEEKFTVTDGKYVYCQIEYVNLVKNAFETVTFGPGTHTAKGNVSTMTIEVPEGLTITFVAWMDLLSNKK